MFQIGGHGEDRCITFGRRGRKHTWVFHVSVGGPIWWKPDGGRKKYRGITEWRAGWLLMAVQIARRPN